MVKSTDAVIGFIAFLIIFASAPLWIPLVFIVRLGEEITKQILKIAN